MKWFRKKRIMIEAEQWFAHSYSLIPVVRYHGGDFGWIDTLEGTMKVNNGDWVIKGIQGEYYPCKPDIFEATYETVE
jgi:hypothetical protein